MFGALHGLKVIEMGHVVAGPFCGALLGDFGAEVIKVETPGAGDGLRSMGEIKNMSFAVEGRNKKCITLNLKSEKGKEILKELIKDADILIENYRPGVLAKLGFDFDNLQKINKRLILVSISGFGQTGPYRERPGYDSIGMAIGGLTHVTGFPDGPPTRPGLIVADYMTGTFACLGAMMAVYNRDIVGTGVGQIVDAALYESIFRITESTTSLYSYNGKIRGRVGNGHLATVPSGHFETKDGKWLVLAVGNDKVFANFCKAIGREDLLEDPKLQTQIDRVKQRKYIEDIAVKWCKNHTLEENLEAFRSDVPASPIYTIEDIVNDEHYKARNSIVEIEDHNFGKILMQNAVPKLSATPGEVKWTGPAMGQHNEEIYARLGYTKDCLKKLEDEGVI